MVEAEKEEKKPKVFKVSPSQVATWRECKRKWAWRHIAKIELPPHKSAALGTETHSQLETYLEGGDIDFTKPSGYIAQSAINANLLPAPKSEGVELERYFTFTSARGHTYHGYMDIIAKDATVFPGMTVVRPAVSDHKTTSNLAYIKTPADLRTDPQGVIYAKAAFELFPEATEADLIWTYMLTRGARKARRTHLPVVKENVEKEFQKIELTVSEIVATHTAQTAPLDLPATTSACDNFGGCPYRSMCTDLSRINPEGKQMTPETENMFKDLTNRLPAEQRPAGVDVLPAWATAPVDPLKAKPVSAPADPLGGFGLTSAPVVPPAVTLDTTILPPAAINPPGEALPESAALLPPPAPVEEKPKRGRGRPKAEPVQAAPAQLALPTQTIPAPAPATQGWTLYIDCLPVGGSYTAAETLFALAQKRIKEESENGVDDYRLVDFGKGPGLLSALVKELAESGQYGDIVLDTRAHEGMTCVAALAGIASRVVRSVR